MALSIAALMRLPERLNPSSTSISRIHVFVRPQERIGLDPADQAHKLIVAVVGDAAVTPRTPAWDWWAWPTLRSWDRWGLRITLQGGSCIGIRGPLILL